MPDSFAEVDRHNHISIPCHHGHHLQLSVQHCRGTAESNPGGLFQGETIHGDRFVLHLLFLCRVGSEYGGALVLGILGGQSKLAGHPRGVAVRDRNFHLRGQRIHGNSYHARLPRLARFQAVGIRALDPEGACVSRGSRVKRLFYHAAGNHNLGHPRRQSIRQEKPPVLRQFRGGLLFGAFTVMSA